MRLLLLAPRADDRCYTGVWALNVERELRVLGVDVVLAPLPRGDEEARAFFAALDVRADALLACGNRFFSTLTPATISVLRKRLRGTIAQLHEGAREDPGVDVTFCAKVVPPGVGRSVCVGWAADTGLYAPAQEHGVFRVLVDHPHYSTGGLDLTYSTLVQLRALWAAVERLGQRWECRAIVVGGVQDVDLSAEIHVREFARARPLDRVDLAREIGRARVFAVTHQESLGLTALEAAMAGCFVLAPRGFLPADRLATIRHREWWDWLRAEDLSAIIAGAAETTANRAKANVNTWRRVAETIAATLRRRNR